MQDTFDDLPYWTFLIEEVSANCYKLMAKHKLGCVIELTGDDDQELLAQGKKHARDMEEDIERKLKSL